MTRSDSQSAVETSEYRAALEAQQDYESTPEGRRRLQQAFAAATSDSERRSLRARIVSGASARRFRQEQAALMPPGLKRSDAGYEARTRLAEAREDVARLLGFAAAESDALRVPTQRTFERLRRASRAALEADLALHRVALPWRHMMLPSQPGEELPPWVGKRVAAPEPGDVAVLLMLGVDAQWLDDALVIKGDWSAAAAWGYRVEASAGDLATVAARPQITASTASS